MFTPFYILIITIKWISYIIIKINTSIFLIFVGDIFVQPVLLLSILYQLLARLGTRPSLSTLDETLFGSGPQTKDVIEIYGEDGTGANY